MLTHYAAIARHGDYHQPQDVPSAHLPYGLTPRGREQASELGRTLAALAQTHSARLHPVLDSSTLLRAYETATLAADALREAAGDQRYSVQQFDSLCERSVGAMANLTLDQIEAALRQDARAGALPPGWKADADYRLPVPGAESLRQAGERVAGHLLARMRDVADGAAEPVLKVFVGHGGAIRHAAVRLGLLEASQLPAVSMHHCRPLLLSFRSDDGFQHVAGAWKLRGQETPATD